MNFKAGAGVRKYKMGGPYRPYVGLHGMEKKYSMGRWSFNNAISATVFEHIVSMGDVGYAPDAIMYFEELLREPHLKDISSLDIFDLAGAIPHPASQAVSKVGGFIKSMSGSVGKLIADATFDSHGSYNPHTAVKKKKYVEHMLAYWGKHTKAGPAYMYKKTDPSVRRNENLPEFKPF